MKNNIILSYGSFTIGLFLIQSTYGAPPTVSKGATSGPQQDITIIEVYSRHWKEDLLMTPVNTTKISGDHFSGDKIDIITNRVSNIGLEDSSVQTRVSIRGISSFDGGLQDPVGYFINDVALPLGGNQLPSLFDVESLEIVKGPQGALYGRNTEAGAVKITTSSPSWTPSSWGSISSGAMDGADGNAATHTIYGGVSNALIKDTLAATVSLRSEKTQGPYLNTYDNDNSGSEIEKWSTSSGITYLFNDESALTLKSIIEKTDEGRNRFRFNSGANKTERFTTNTDSHGKDATQTQIHSLTFDYNFDRWLLTSITGYTHYENNFKVDLDATPAPLPNTTIDLSDESLSEEIRLSSNDPEAPFKWLSGIYLYKENSNVIFNISPQFVTTARKTTIDQHGQALFGQIEVGFANRWNASIGGRYEVIKKNGSQFFSRQPTEMDPGTEQNFSADIDEREFLPKASVSFSPNTHHFLFISYSKGYLPGGYNYSSSETADSFTFDAEYSTSTELGWKFRANSQKITTGLSLFNVETEDKQIIDLLPGFIQRVSNSGRATAQGLEFNVDFAHSPTLTTYATLGLQQTENSTSTNEDTNSLPYSPKSSYSLGILYQPQQGVFGDISMRGFTDYYFNHGNTIKQPNSLILDARFGYQFKSTQFELWVKNATNETIFSRAVTTPLGVIVEDTLPRSFGVKLSIKK